MNVPYTFEPVNLKYPEEVKGLISIIIPIYNTDIYLRESLDSVIAQTFENWEAILIDDGSTDKSPEICTEYVEKDSRFKYIRKNNEGTLLARKTALENSRGEFIASLDSDDAYQPHFLEKMFSRIKEGDNDFVYCNIVNILNEKTEIYKAENYILNENKLQNCYNLSKYNNSLCCKLIKRSIYEKVLYPRIHGGFRSEDRSQVLQIVYHSNRAELVTECSYLYRYNSIFSIANTTTVATKQKRYVRCVISGIVLYQLADFFFGTDEAEKFVTSPNGDEFYFLIRYFLLSRKDIVHYRIEYASNFIPIFLRGLKKSQNKNFYNLLLVLACKGFALPFKIYYEVSEFRAKLRIRTRIKKLLRYIH